MFAFCLVDFTHRRFLLARDQLGIKPLFWTADRRRLAFASELAALRLLPGLDATLDWEAVDQYLQLQYIPPPRTVFRAVCKLPPAHVLSGDLDGAVSEPRRFWSLTYAPREDLSPAAWEERLDDPGRRDPGPSRRGRAVRGVSFRRGGFEPGGRTHVPAVRGSGQDVRHRF